VGSVVLGSIRSLRDTNRVSCFLRGPIPWNWLSIAMDLPPTAVRVGLALWFLGRLQEVRRNLTHVADMAQDVAFTATPPIAVSSIWNAPASFLSNAIVVVAPL
jgi:hypothetical protein